MNDTSLMHIVHWWEDLNYQKCYLMPRVFTEPLILVSSTRGSPSQRFTNEKNLQDLRKIWMMRTKVLRSGNLLPRNGPCRRHWDITDWRDTTEGTLTERTLLEGHYWKDNYWKDISEGTLLKGHYWRDTFEETLLKGHFWRDTTEGTLLKGHYWRDTTEGTLRATHPLFADYNYSALLKTRIFF